MKNFTFAMKWHEILRPYSSDIRREVYEAVIEYAASGNIIDMQPLARMAFDFIRYEIDEKARKREARKAKKSQSVDKTEPQAHIEDNLTPQMTAEKPVTHPQEDDEPKQRQIKDKPLPLTATTRLQMQLPAAMRKKGIKVKLVNQRVDRKRLRVA
ncbi:MAG: hypothetical protein K2M11_03055 [Paramuribaculum sp.]|nr:hypothetical protein [Paramuribaculum sp.]